MPDVIYLDANASTPCDSQVVHAMLPFFAERFANPSSRSHTPGREAFSALEEARRTVARCLGAASATEIVFTSGATEANNLAIRAAAAARTDHGRHLVSQKTEHPSVLQPLAALRREGWEVTLLGVDEGGRIRTGELEQALRPDTVLVSLMLANNETGVLQPVAEAAALAHARGALLHCDAAQGPGKLLLDLGELGADLASFSAHKAYGPKGVGAVYLRRGRPPLRLEPMLAGGGQERGLRSGTPNLPGAAGLAAALELAAERTDEDASRTAILRDRLEQEIMNGLDGVRRNGDLRHRLPNTTNLSFAGVDGSALLASLPDLAVSTGSACSSAAPEPSPVLRAMGVPPGLAAASLRFSLTRHTTEEEIGRAAQRVMEEVRRLRG
ncbi:MAG: cysteine desulfurase [Acidobacteria bacterium]|nr:cysteine desulfurase [Acidobacteriota bacterium]